MDSAIRFLTTQDGVRVAYCGHGQGPALVFVRGWISHLEMMWADQAFRAFFEALGRRFRVIRFDARGNGLSDREPAAFTLEGLALDLEAVIDTLDLSEVVLFATTFGGPIAISYATRHPERVTRLVMDGAFFRGQDLATPEQREALISAISGLGPAAFFVLSLMTDPEPNPKLHQRATRAMEAITNQAAVALYSLAYEIDVSHFLPQLTMPTLVLHRRGSRSIPFEHGRRLASLIPGARFVALEGTAHNPWEGDAAATLDAIGRFLDVDLELTPAATPAERRSPLTVLFTDIEGSTSLTQRLGDAAAQEVLRAHNAIVREALAAHGGSEVKHTGDGIMASFPSASRAVECAIAIQRAVDEASRVAGHGSRGALRVRIGINAGEPMHEDDDLFGTAVQLARRVCDTAGAGEILVTDVVRQLAMGKVFAFSEREAAALKGFDEPVRLYQVAWGE